MIAMKTGSLVMLTVFLVGFAAYLAGLYAGAIQCSHRCYWCGRHLCEKEATP